jgi:hypothetical protein
MDVQPLLGATDTAWYSSAKLYDMRMLWLFSYFSKLHAISSHLCNPLKLLGELNTLLIIPLKVCLIFASDGKIFHRLNKVEIIK